MCDFFSLYNGNKIPSIGYGTWQTPDGEKTVAAVRAALSLGYRHIDTAAAYGNEASVGRAVRESGISREELFVTSKVWNTDRGYQKTREAFDRTLNMLQMDYLDLYLIHWPASPSRFPDWEEINRETWRAMTDLYKEGRIRSVGVSNFMPAHLKALMEAEITPMVNQIELNPGHRQTETVGFCQEHQILVEAWSPLGTGRILEEKCLSEMASRYGKSTAQFCLRWCLQKGILPLPKSMTPSRIKENKEVFDFRISKEDMEAVELFPEFGASGKHPDTVNF